MPLRILSTIKSPIPLPSASLASSLPLARANNPSTPRDSQDGEVHLDSAGQPKSKSRSGRPLTPTKRSLEGRAQSQRREVNRNRRQQKKALKAAGKDGGKRKGEAQRGASTASGQLSATDAEDDEDEDEDEDDDVDGEDTSTVPTSDPRELLEQLAGGTFGDELGDPGFRSGLSAQINAILDDKEKREHFSRETLQEALRIVRRNPSVSDGASRRVSPGDEHSQVRGGSGYPVDREPQSGDKRPLDASQVGSSKRSRAGLSRTPSTVIEGSLPLFGVPFLGGRALPPSGLPPTALRPRVEMPKGLPRSKAIYIDRSPSPLPASFRAALVDTQTVPEDTQTVPEDTQTVPENTQVDGPAPEPAPSSPDLGAPPSNVLRPLPSLPASLSRNSATSTAHVAPSSGFDERVRQLEKMAAQFDYNERLRERAYAFRKARMDPQGSSTNADDIPAEDAAQKADERNVAAGKATKRKRKAGLNCQGGRPRQAASRAIADMCAFLFSVGPYISSGSLLVVAMEAYERAFEFEFPGVPLEEPYPELIEAISDRAPLARTVAKTNLQSMMTAEGGFGFIMSPETQQQIDANVQRYLLIREDFHYGNLDNPQSHYEHPALKSAFVAAFFADRHSPCAVYHTYFSPAVPPQSVAVLLTLLESCIAEWSTGVEKKENLNSQVQGPVYEKHMRNLRIFADAAPERFTRMRLSFYAAGCRQSVVDATADPSNAGQATIHREDIRPDTPPPTGSMATNEVTEHGNGGPA